MPALQALGIPAEKLPHLLLRIHRTVFVPKVHRLVREGHVGMNAVQRKHVHCAVDDGLAVRFLARCGCVKPIAFLARSGYVTPIASASLIVDFAVQQRQGRSRHSDMLLEPAELADSVCAVLQGRARHSDMLLEPVELRDSGHTIHSGQQILACFENISLKVLFVRLASSLSALSLALCMGTHPRLGAASALAGLDSALLQRIFHH
ncbi:hypothetical protein T484DRAFT_1781664, partial [Baffinella frigidus]